ncbi:MAG: alkaline phosphatase family protein, partial [Planctomycetes bacterium]|nr:alkaline phosphatase family protein [Planctomycetota bacterium]
MRNACTLILLLLFAAAPLHAEETGKKVVVLGIDAMDTRLAEKWMDAGDLPNFDKLRKQGHYSPLETSYPPMSPAAWSTMTTGQNPGKTGIFGFLKRREGTYEPELSLARANEQPLLGGGPWMRLLMALGFAFGVTAVALAMGRVANRIFRNRKPVNQLVPASVVVAAVLVSPVGALDARMLALYGIGGMAVGVLIFGYLAALNGLKFRYWLFPLLALAVGAFSFLNNLPETVPQPVTSRSGTTFWKMADDRGVRCRVIGAPVNWPAAEEFAESKMTTGLATPDAMGTFHTYTLFSEPHNELAGGLTEMSGRVESLEFDGDVAQARLLGPPAKFDRKRWKQWEDHELNLMPREEIPFTVTRADGGGVTLRFAEANTVESNEIHLDVGDWERHFRVVYNIGGLFDLHGTVSFKLLAGGSQVRLYATPVNFDPKEQLPQFAVSQPLDFAPWLADQYGMFETIGWAEATSALQDGMIDDGTFLETCQLSFDEKRKQILGMLDHSDEWDLFVAYTYEIDRVCHMMWRHMDEHHPNHDPHAPAAWKTAIHDFYVKYDGLVGEMLAKLPKDAVLMICSDHGFLPFYRAVNVNRWLQDNGYLELKEKTGAPTMEHLFDNDSGYYSPYDWSKTRAYALGLSKIYINLKGREPEGIVDPDDAESLKNEIIAKLEKLQDDAAHGYAPVISVVKKREEIWQGDRLEEAGDLQIGYARGYRVSWQTSLGGADEPV